MATDRGSDETLYAYLERRERELIHQVATLKAQLDSKGTELAHVQSAKRQIGNLGGNDRAKLGAPSSFGTLGHIVFPHTSEAHKTLSEALAETSSKMAATAEGLARGILGITTPYTIKQHVVLSLHDHFRDAGASADELREFIKNAYGRDIERTSLSPQLTRLKEEGVIVSFAGGDNRTLWRLAPGKGPGDIVGSKIREI